MKMAPANDSDNGEQTTLPILMFTSFLNKYYNENNLY